MPPRTRSNRAEFEDSSTRQTNDDAPSTDESDIEVDLEESSLLQVKLLTCLQNSFVCVTYLCQQATNSMPAQ